MNATLCMQESPVSNQNFTATFFFSLSTSWCSNVPSTFALATADYLIMKYFFLVIYLMYFSIWDTSGHFQVVEFNFLWAHCSINILLIISIKSTASLLLFNYPRIKRLMHIICIIMIFKLNRESSLDSGILFLTNIEYLIEFKIKAMFAKSIGDYPNQILVLLAIITLKELLHILP